MGELPRSLQSIIEEARESLARDPIVYTEEEFPDLSDEDRADLNDDSFLQELARGEYSQAFYWQCVAEDCEDDSDWDGARSAYRKVIEVPLSDAQSHWTRWRTYRDLSALNAMLGDSELALDQAVASATAAADAGVEEGGDVMLIYSLTAEAWLLVKLGRFDEARRSALRAQSIKIGIEDAQGSANLLVVLAACDVKQRRLLTAGWKLSRALRLLERSKQVWAVCGPLPRGIEHASYAWWTVQADRSRERRDSDAERSAWHQAIDIARRLVEDPVGSRVYDEARLMRTLLDAADSFRRSGREAEAVPLAEEAHAIHQRWKLPEAALHRRFA